MKLAFQKQFFQIVFPNSRNYKSDTIPGIIKDIVADVIVYNGLNEAIHSVFSTTSSNPV